jgi:hypothetical protein
MNREKLQVLPFMISIALSNTCAQGGSLDDIKKLCPQAVLGEGIDISAFDTNPKDAARVTTPNRNVTAWVRRSRTAR